MKKRGVLITTLFMTGLAMWTLQVVYNALTGSTLIDYNKLIGQNIKNEGEKIQNIIAIDKCSIKDKIDLKDTDEPHLKALSKYQDFCNSLATDTLMIFIDIPKDNAVAKENAKKTAETLKKFHDKGVKPLVIVEPVSEWGLIDFVEFRTGFYDTWITTYFKELKKQGITDEMMGTWVPFPEANLPYWNHQYATPSDFSFVVNKYLKIMKSQFPKAKGSILLNSATYETDDFDWVNGEYISLIPYVKDLDPKLVDSVGLQGLPWISRQGEDAGSVFNTDEFLNESLIDEVAKEVGVKEIWLNTGTLGAKYTIDPESTVYVNSEKRKDLLNGILSEASQLKKKGYSVTVNIFAEDKSFAGEATDWSYLPDSYSKDSDAFATFSEFTAKAESLGVIVSMFDKVAEQPVKN